MNNNDCIKSDSVGKKVWKSVGSNSIRNILLIIITFVLLLPHLKPYFPMLGKIKESSQKVYIVNAEDISSFNNTAIPVIVTNSELPVSITNSEVPVEISSSNSTLNVEIQNSSVPVDIEPNYGSPLYVRVAE
jgi:hypothetical protein